MSIRTSLGYATALSIVTAAIALAEPKAVLVVGTDNAAAVQRAEDQTKQLEAAKRSYLKLKNAAEGHPGAVSDESLSKTSLLVLRLETAVARTREDGIKAASAYLHREGQPVPK